MWSRGLIIILSYGCPRDFRFCKLFSSGEICTGKLVLDDNMIMIVMMRLWLQNEAGSKTTRCIVKGVRHGGSFFSMYHDVN